MRREIDKTLRPSWALVRQVLAKGWRLEAGKLIAPSGNWVWCEPVGRDTGEKP